MVAEGVRTTERRWHWATHGIDCRSRRNVGCLAGVPPENRDPKLMGRKQKLEHPTDGRTGGLKPMGNIRQLKQGLQKTSQQLKNVSTSSTRWSTRAGTGGARARDRRGNGGGARRDSLMADVGVAASGNRRSGPQRQKRGEGLRDLVKQEILRLLEARVGRRMASKPQRDV